MAVRIRLQRHGRKKRPFYFIVAVDSRKKRDGIFIEKLGTYNPIATNNQVQINAGAAVKWLLSGAKPSDTVRSILSKAGVMLKKHLQVGVNKGALTQEQADEKFNVWLEEKQNQKEKQAKTKASQTPPADKITVHKEIDLSEENEQNADSHTE